MRGLCMLLTFIITSAVQAEIPLPFQVEGSYTSATPVFAYLYIAGSPPQKPSLQKTTVTNSRFLFTGFVESNNTGYSVARIFFDSSANLTIKTIVARSRVASNYTEIVLDQKVAITFDRTRTISSVAGSLINEEYLELQKIRSLVNGKVLSNNLDRQLACYSALADFVVRHTSSPLALTEFRRILSLPSFMRSRLRTDLTILFSAVDSSWLLNPVAKSISAEINRKQSVPKFRTGVVLPDYVFNDAEDSVSVSHYRGKYLLLFFWASWSLPSERFHHQLEKEFIQYPGGSFAVLQVSLDNNISGWRKFFEGRKVLWKQARLKRGWDEKVVMAFDITTLPHNYLLDKSGKVIGQDLSPAAIIELLKKLPG